VALGILGGTFNPPHRGHLALARHALRELALERVLLMPARLPPHKTTAEDPGPSRRLEMCRLLVDGAEGLGVSALELEREGPSYTVDTLRALHAAHPATGLRFIVGADVARTLPTWREPRELLALAGLGVALRAGSSIGEVQADLAPLLGAIQAGGRVESRHEPEDRVRFLSMPAIEVSSSLVRERVRRGEPVQELVGEAVAGYIAEHDLYREPVSKTAVSQGPVSETPAR
jgi:nicotinate-nucleotide adenylyltransferase